MTIGARAFENRRDLWRHLRVREDRLRFVDDGIRSRRSDELDTKDENHERETQELYYL